MLVTFFMACGVRRLAMATTSAATAATRRACRRRRVTTRSCSTSAPGLRYFGQTRCRQPFRGTCLVSHLHWDHVQGLPFFGPILQPEESDLDVYAPVHDDGARRPRSCARRSRPPIFPVGLDAFPGTVDIRDVGDASSAGGFARRERRRAPCRRDARLPGRRTAHRASPTSPTTSTYDGGARSPTACSSCADGVDLLIHDAQYTPAEFARKSTWGHCTVEYAVWLAGEVGGGAWRCSTTTPTARRRHDRPPGRRRAIAGGAAMGVEVFAASPRAWWSISPDAVTSWWSPVSPAVVLGVGVRRRRCAKLGARRGSPRLAAGRAEPVAPVVPGIELVLGACWWPARRRRRRPSRPAARRVQRALVRQLSRGSPAVCLLRASRRDRSDRGASSATPSSSAWRSPSRWVGDRDPTPSAGRRGLAPRPPRVVAPDGPPWPAPISVRISSGSSAGADGPQLGDPLRRLVVADPRIVQPGGDVERRVVGGRCCRRASSRACSGERLVARVAPLLPLGDGERQGRVTHRRHDVDERHLGDGRGTARVAS